MYADSEIQTMDLLACAGLGNIGPEERVEYSLEFSSLMGLAAIGAAMSQLSDKDAETAVGFLEREEPERLEAFIASRGIDLQRLVIAETVRVKRTIIETGRQFGSLDELDLAVKALLPPELLVVGMAGVQEAEAEVDDYIDSLPTTEEKKCRLKAVVEYAIEKEAMARIEAGVPPQVFGRIRELFDSGNFGQALTLLLDHGIDLMKLQAEVTRGELRRLQQAITDR